MDKQKTNSSFLMSIWSMIPMLFLIILISIIILFYFQIKSEGELIEAKKIASLKEDIASVNVVTLKLSLKPIKDRISLPGIIEPWIKLNVLTEVKGKLLYKKVEEGQQIKKGDIIAVLDSRDYKNTYNSAKASYKSALASLNRLKELYKGKLSTRSQLDDAEALVENNKAAMDNAALNLERCVIKAPIKGTINRLFIEQGQYLNASSEIAEILQIDRVKVKVGIPESDVSAVRELQDFNVIIDALDKKVYKAKKKFLSKTADANARLYSLDLVIENADFDILPDMFARVEIVKKHAEKAIAVPLYSVISINNENKVYIEKQGVAYSRKVELGMQENWMIEITKGLEPGDNLIAVGQRGINDKQKVNVIRSVTNPEDLVR